MIRRLNWPINKAFKFQDENDDEGESEDEKPAHSRGRRDSLKENENPTANNEHNTRANNNVRKKPAVEKQTKHNHEESDNDRAHVCKVILNTYCWTSS